MCKKNAEMFSNGNCMVAEHGRLYVINVFKHNLTYQTEITICINNIRNHQVYK